MELFRSHKNLALAAQLVEQRALSLMHTNGRKWGNSMTRQEFIDEVTTWADLLDFCNNEDCDICMDIIDCDTMDEMVEEDLRNAVGGYSWQGIRDLLNDVNDEYAYYRNGGSFNYEPVEESDFDDYKDDVLDWMDRRDLWEEGDMEEEDDNEGETEAEESPAETEDFSVIELMDICSTQFLDVQRETARCRQQDDAEMEQYLKTLC